MDPQHKSALEQKEGLWRNCQDSVIHALEHFSAASQVADRLHDRKWAILSVAHAAEIYCNLLLCEFDPNHPNRQDRHYPPLDGARTLLRDHARLTDSERYVIEEVLSPLATQRNTLMHMPAPEMLGATETAIALLSLLHIIRRRLGLETSEFFDQSPPIERDIFEEIDWRKHDSWFKVAEKLVGWEYGPEQLETCSECGSFAVIPEETCQACFYER
jgi:hypothetical protein